MFVTGNYVAALHYDKAIEDLNANCFSSAIAEFNECLIYNPGYKLAYWYRALCKLALGDYIGGFKDYEIRWDICDWRWGILGDDIFKIRALPAWQGEPLTGKRVLFFYEEGYGDAIQMLRYIPVLEQLGARVTALMPPPLQRLVRYRFFVPVIGEVPDDLSQFDYRCPCFGAMVPLKQDIDTIPRLAYLKPKRGFKYLGHRALGICWSGRSRNELKLKEFLSLLDCDAFNVYSLQPGDTPAPVIPLHADDFADTVRAIVHMDHIVTVDTSLAHLAGAMGHPSTHVLLPWNTDWRWYNAQVWYPGIKTYRQERKDDWSVPFARIRACLTPMTPQSSIPVMA